MNRAKAIKEILDAGGKPVKDGAYLRFTFHDRSVAYSFFPNHYENMRRGEVEAYVRGVKDQSLGRRRPKN